MDYNTSERQGRFTLRSLLWFIALSETMRALLPVFLDKSAALPAAAAFALLPLLPAAVALWAVYRGSWPGLVVFFLTTFNLLISVTDYLAPGGPRLLGELLSGPMGAYFTAWLFFSVLALILRLVTVYNVFRGDTVSRYFELRRYRRHRKDLILEIVLFALAVVAAVLVQLLPLLFLIQ